MKRSCLTVALALAALLPPLVDGFAQDMGGQMTDEALDAVPLAAEDEQTNEMDAEAAYEAAAAQAVLAQDSAVVEPDVNDEVVTHESGSSINADDAKAHNDDSAKKSSMIQQTSPVRQFQPTDLSLMGPRSILHGRRGDASTKGGFGQQGLPGYSSALAKHEAGSEAGTSYRLQQLLSVEHSRRKHAERLVRKLTSVLNTTTSALKQKDYVVALKEQAIANQSRKEVEQQAAFKADLQAEKSRAELCKGNLSFMRMALDSERQTSKALRERQGESASHCESMITDMHRVVSDEQLMRRSAEKNASRLQTKLRAAEQDIEKRNVELATSRVVVSHREDKISNLTSALQQAYLETAELRHKLARSERSAKTKTMQLNQELREITRDAKEFREEKLEVVNRNTQLKRQLHEKEQEFIKNLNKEKANGQASLARAYAEIQDLNVKSVKLHSQLEDSHVLMQKTQQAASAENQQALETRQEMASLKQQLRNVQSELDGAQIRARQADVLEKQLKDLLHENAKLRQSNFERVNQLNDAVSNIQQENKALDYARGTLKETFKKLKSMNQAKRLADRRVRSLWEAFQQKKVQLQIRDEEISHVDQQLQVEKAQESRIRKQLNTTDGEFSMDDIIKRVKELGEMRAKYAKLRSYSEAQDEELQAMRAQVAHAARKEEELNATRARLASAMAEERELVDQLATASKDAQDKSAAAAAKEEELNEKLNEVHLTSSALNDVREDLNSSRMELARTISEKNNLQSKLDDFRRKAEDLEVKSGKSGHMADIVKRLQSELDEQSKEAKDKTTSMSQEIAQLKKQLKTNSHLVHASAPEAKKSSALALDEKLRTDKFMSFAAQEDALRKKLATQKDFVNALRANVTAEARATASVKQKLKETLEVLMTRNASVIHDEAVIKSLDAAAARQKSMLEAAKRDDERLSRSLDERSAELLKEGIELNKLQREKQSLETKVARMATESARLAKDRETIGKLNATSMFQKQMLEAAKAEEKSLRSRSEGRAAEVVFRNKEIAELRASLEKEQAQANATLASKAHDKMSLSIAEAKLDEESSTVRLLNARTREEENMLKVARGKEGMLVQSLQQKDKQLKSTNQEVELLRAKAVEEESRERKVKQEKFNETRKLDEEAAKLRAEQKELNATKVELNISQEKAVSQSKKLSSLMAEKFHLKKEITRLGAALHRQHEETGNQEPAKLGNGKAHRRKKRRVHHLHAAKKHGIAHHHQHDTSAKINHGKTHNQKVGLVHLRGAKKHGPAHHHQRHHHHHHT